MMALRRVGQVVGIAFGGTAVVAGGSAAVYAYVEPASSFHIFSLPFLHFLSLKAIR